MDPIKKYGYTFSHIGDCSICGLYCFVTKRSEKCVACVIVERKKFLKSYREKVKTNPKLKKKQAAQHKKHADKWYKKMRSDPERLKKYRKDQNAYFRKKRITENKVTLGSLKNELDKNEQQRD